MKRLASVLLAGYLLIHLLALPSAPLTDDDDFYIPAGNDYAAWLGRVARFDTAAFERSSIDAAFDANHEHPPVAKYVFGICGAAFSGLFGPVSGPRVGSALFSTLAAAMLLWMAILQLGWSRGLLAGGLGLLFLLTLPRFFFHARAATLDVPVAGMYALCAGLALQAERAKWAALALGPAFGLATATKLNAPFFIVPYLIYALLVRGGTASAALGPGSGRSLKLPSLPVGLLSMAVLGPLTFFAVWPWMWFDVVDRVSTYVQFHLGHYGIYFLYFGQIYEKNPFAPWHAPFVLAAVTVPVAVSVLAMIGIGLGSRAVLHRIYLGHAAGDPALSEEDRSKAQEGELVLWLVLHAFFSVAVVAFSGGAKYGGAKLFMPFFPFWCLLAGYAGLRIWDGLRDQRHGLWLAGGLLALVLGSSIVQKVRFWSAPLSQYNALAGGLRGATTLGFERQYYDLAFRDLVAFLSKEAPPGTRIHFLPNNWEYVRTFRWYLKEGTLRSDLRVVQAEAQASWIVLTHERRFRRYGEDLRRMRKLRVVSERRIDGVPLWTVLERP